MTRSQSSSTSAPATRRSRSRRCGEHWRGRGIRPQVFFLEARDEVLIRASRRPAIRHPLADQRGIASSIAQERRLLDPVRSDADVVIDTSDLSLRELRERIFARLGDATDPTGSRSS